MRTRSLLRLAWRESRSARRRLALYMSSIAFGVAALVAIDSFAGNVTASIRAQSRTLLGGDFSLQANAALPAAVDTLLDSLASAGIANARVTTFASMAQVQSSGNTRLVQVRAVSRGYPFYGVIETMPAGGWARVHDVPVVFVDPSLLVALSASVGDSLRLGLTTFAIAGTLGNVPGDAGIASVLGPRVYISSRWLPATELLRAGSRAEYEAVLRAPTSVSEGRAANRFARTLRRRIDPVAAAQFEAAQANARRNDRAPAEEEPEPTSSIAVRDSAAAASAAPTASTVARDSVRPADSSRAAASGLVSAAPRTRVRIRTVADTERDFTESVARLADFLGIIGLIALLLGGIGVASGVNAFVSSKIDTVAVLRCLGATSRQVLLLYVLQSSAMGIVGASAGAALGVAVQFLLPNVVGEFLPVDVAIAIEPLPLLLGLATGVWVALIFALRPLLALRRISPLQAIRREGDASVALSWRDPARMGVDALLIGSVLAIIVTRIGEWRDGLIVAGGIAAAILVLWVAATLLIALARRSTIRAWPFPLRQGIANLHRPANQTRAVTLALGFGAFLLSTVYLLQSNLLSRVQATSGSANGNLLFFDVQDDQAAPLDALLRRNGVTNIQRTPIVTMRIDAINGRSVAALVADTVRRRAGWALRREYRSTYRDTLVTSEKLVSGTWFSDSNASAVAAGLYPVSMESELATDLAVQLGDTIVWNVQGVAVRTRITSIRTVNWARFEANFFVVFAPDAIRRAPQQHVFIADVRSKDALASVQRDAVRQFPNVSSVDLSLVQQTIGAIVDKVTLAIRFLGLFSIAMGIPVLFSAVAATRRARLREGVLLRTLGASRAQIVRILLSEYGALGTLGALSGMLLSFGGAWGLSYFVFDDPFSPAVLPALAIAGGMLALTMGIGVLTSRDVYRETPMAAIRES